MKWITTKAEFECLGNIYAFDISILIDTVGHKLRFQFTAVSDDWNKLPIATRTFDVVTTFHQKVVFNRLAASDDQLQEAIRDCVDEYVRNFQHPDLRN